MKTYTFTRCLAVLVLLMLCYLPLRPQDAKILQQLLEEEQQTLDAIALYPERERRALLEASLHPEILARMQRMQSHTQQEFRSLLADLPQEEQKKLYELIRYPELLESATAGERKMKENELRQLAKDYPENIQEDLLWANRQQYPLLLQISELYRSSEQSFAHMLERYSDNTRQAYQELVSLPEVVQLMADNMGATVLLGDIYRQQPEVVMQKLDSLKVVLAEQKAEEVRAWQQHLEENPEALAEYEQAAQEFARDQGYSEEEQQVNTSAPRPGQVTEVHVHPYPYWFGWPTWYSYPIWYPYPWWYHWGFYYGPQNVIIIVGLPSFYFVHWHFYHPPNFYYYPHFTHVFLRYSERHPYHPISREVDRWRYGARSELPAKWFNNDGRRVERIRELGAFKIAYQKELNRRRNGLSEREFLRRHAQRYPSLEPVLRESPSREARARAEQETPRPRERTVERPQERPPQQPRQQPREQPRQKAGDQPQTDQPQAPGRTRVEEKEQSEQQKVEKARKHHENTWEELKRRPQIQTPRQTTQPRQPAPKRTDRKRTDEQKSTRESGRSRDQ